MYLSKTKGILLLFLLTLLSITALAFIYCNPHYKAITQPRGKFLMNIYINHQLYPLMSGHIIYTFNNYCLEVSKTIIDDAVVKVSPDGKQNVTKYIGRDSISAYLLTDLQNKICYEFTGNNDKPQFVKKYSLDKKKIGMNYKEENLPINSNELANFTYIKDTVINNRPFKQIKCIGDVKTPTGLSPSIYTVYVDQSLKESPFHLLSKYLDNKFDGLASIADIKSNDGAFRIVYDFSDGLTAMEINQVQKFIEAAKFQMESIKQ